MVDMGVVAVVSVVRTGMLLLSQLRRLRLEVEP